MGGVKTPRTRRATSAQATRRRVIDAATRLFVQSGYHATTIEAIAAAADVSVETIYKRFGNKAGLLKAAREATVAESAEPPEFFEFPAPPVEAALAATTDVEEQLRALAGFSARRLTHLSAFHRMLRSAGTGDPELGEYVAADHALRRERQRANIHAIAANGPLRLDRDQAADTYSALANPDLYLLVVDRFGWTADQFSGWLVDATLRLLLPDD